MAAIDDLISQIDNPDLRQKIKQQVRQISQHKKFGLVFEQHKPECTPLYGVPIAAGSKVAPKAKKIENIYIAGKIEDGKAVCQNVSTKKSKTFALNDLVRIAEFGDPIYPYLQKIDSISTAPNSDLWHTLIEADNYHALQLLDYLYAGKVDCIYIDPPYNTGAHDWKYNNNYVDNSDAYRHSKWLSFMEKRLKLAKKLLNPTSSVLICTIDEKEYLHLGMLLEQLFPGARIQMVSSIINPAGVARDNEFARVNEYLFFVFIGTAGPQKLHLSDEWLGNIHKSKRLSLRWNSLMRTGTHNMRADSLKEFYPIFVAKNGSRIVKIGDSLPQNVNRSTVKELSNCKTIWPIHINNQEGCWQVSQKTLRSLIKKGYVRLGRFTSRGMAISYLKKGEQKKVESGLFPVTGHRNDGSVIVNESARPAIVPGNQWNISSHNATTDGSILLNHIIGERRFTFPKSLYAVYDALRFIVANKPNALIVDFFAGSGTTLQAVNMLNKEDGGHRRCILVTNNEVSEDEAKQLTKNGYYPGDKEWEELGIARYVTWPRTVCSIKGRNINGDLIKDKYLNTGEPMSDGFKSNVVYFKLGFLDPNSVALGQQFKALLSTLWMKAGCVGGCPQIDSKKPLPDMLVLPKNHFAVLLNENSFNQFKDKVNNDKNIKTIFIVTDSDDGYREMIAQLSEHNTYQLYKDYLDNFKINTRG